MDAPNIDNLMRDKEANITYNVKAYRKLSRQEIVTAIGHYRSQHPKLERNKKITIITTLGFQD